MAYHREYSQEAAKQDADKLTKPDRELVKQLEARITKLKEKQPLVPGITEDVIARADASGISPKAQLAIDKKVKAKAYGGHEPNFKHKKTGELFYSDEQVSQQDQTVFTNRFNEITEVVTEKLSNFEKMGKATPEQKPLVSGFSNSEAAKTNIAPEL